MNALLKLKQWILGKPLNPLRADTRQHIVLVAFLAWVGLGADGLSSSCYGPEQAFLALGTHAHLGLYLAVVTALTVFVIALAYNQVIALYPEGGGGYRVATNLIHPNAGLVSGSALVVDYVLTITISIASGVDALFSLFPVEYQSYKLGTALLIALGLMTLNLRGMKESIKILLPIFLGFVITHFVLIGYGIGAHSAQLSTLWPETWVETTSLANEMGWLFVVALFLRAYSMGGGTYTGIEAISTNADRLAEPRVRTGQWAMTYLALSLALTAGGIILLYLLWQATPTPGQTLNAVTFKSILENWGGSGTWTVGVLLPVVLFFEAALLFVAANTGYIGGPNILANMAADSWMPRQFQYLSARLVTQNGILVMGIASLLILIGTNGDVGLLIVLYSINVFLTYSLSLLGLSKYAWGKRTDPRGYGRILFLGFGLLLTAGILCIMVVEKFSEGGWLTIVITSAVIGLCILIKRHYRILDRLLDSIDAQFTQQVIVPSENPPPIDPQKPTAIFFVGRHIGMGMHTLLWVQRLFPAHFQNFIFLSVGIIDSESYKTDEKLSQMQKSASSTAQYFVNFCHQQGLAAEAYQAYATKTLASLTELAEQLQHEYSDSVFFASRLIFEHDNGFAHMLHNQTALMMQNRLHSLGIPMMVLPMRVDNKT